MGPQRLDLFGIETNGAMFHKAREPAGGWQPQTG
jgi:hypothetical protein